MVHWHLCQICFHIKYRQTKHCQRYSKACNMYTDL